MHGGKHKLHCSQDASTQVVQCWNDCPLSRLLLTDLHPAYSCLHCTLGTSSTWPNQSPSQCNCQVSDHTACTYSAGELYLIMAGCTHHPHLFVLGQLLH